MREGAGGEGVCAGLGMELAGEARAVSCGLGREEED